jgi:uncharacterized protein
MEMYNMEEIANKLAKLNRVLVDLGKVAVAFSGGADSSFLAAAAKNVLGDNAVTVTALSETLPEGERRSAIDFAKSINIKHTEILISELKSQEFIANTSKRCYFCKRERFSVLENWALSQGLFWVLEGSNADDVDDYRPGMEALSEFTKVRSPLLEVGLTKAEIRAVSKEWGLSSWDKPSGACLSSRISYGLKITPERLKQVEQAEIYLKQYCNGQIRVRYHDNLARIEVSPEEIDKLVEPFAAKKIAEYFRKIGFVFVTIDLVGYRMGSMNEILPN